MFVLTVSRILEGKRGYGEQTLATPTLQRLHFLRGVLISVLVRVKVQGAKSMVFSEKQKSGLCIHQNHNCAQQTNPDCAFHCFVRTRIAFQKRQRLALTKQ